MRSSSVKMSDRAFYEFRAPKFVEFSPSKTADKSSYFDLFDGIGMDVDISHPLPAEPSIRWSSTPNKRDSCTQTPSENVEEEIELTEALDDMLCIDRPKKTRSVRFSDVTDVYQPARKSSTGVKESNGRRRSESNGDIKTDSKKRQTTPIIGQTWHQALKYRSVEQHAATPKPGKWRRTSLIADPTLKVDRAAAARKTPSSIPRPVKVRVDPKPEVAVEPFQLTTYKPRQSPIEDPVKFFQRAKDTPVRKVEAKPAVRRLPLTERTAESPNTAAFRARPPVSLYQKPFVPRPVERQPIRTQPFRLHTEERAKKREEFDQKIQQHLLSLEVQRQQMAAERERQEALELKELRRVKIHARPVPSFVYSPVPISPKTPLHTNRGKTNTMTI